MKWYKCIAYHIVETFRKCNVSEFCENSVAARQNKFNEWKPTEKFALTIVARNKLLAFFHTWYSHHSQARTFHTIPGLILQFVPFH